MLTYDSKCRYVVSEDVKLFTAVLTPCANKKFPTIVIRSPYVDNFENCDDESILSKYCIENESFLQNGYAVVIQHCRGRGRSDGDCIPYINERKDTLSLYKWIRKQDFYNGELYLKGASYTSSVHFFAAPYDDDIKGAVFRVQDVNTYNVFYRNGFFKIGLGGDWAVRMYKAKSKMKKNYTKNTFNTLPLSNFSKIVFGESDEFFYNVINSPNPSDDFWQTSEGGVYAKKALENLKMPVLFTTGFYDIYTGGIFKMWNDISDEAKSKCALVVSPYDHGDNVGAGIRFENGKRNEQFGTDYEVNWFNHIRNNLKSPFEKGKVTYYRLFENKWKADDFTNVENELKIKLGNTEETYVYNPYDAPVFEGGLSTNFGGSAFQNAPNHRHDIITVYTDSFEKDTFIKGKMSAKLKVKSDCEDTCFYVRISIAKEQGDYGLRDDITSLCYQKGDYIQNDKVTLDFSFDEHAFLIKKGEKIRIDIASAAANFYVRHTNNKGLYSKQTTAKIANNTVYLKDSYIFLPIEY